METGATADHGNNVTPPALPGGHGGVYVCHKCGWPFPNPNPSSRHRRAHRKICGTLPGYNTSQLQTSYSSVSADDHPSDDDYDFQTPSPNVLERSQSGMGSGGTGGRSNRSEDDVFSDAVDDFVDAGSSTMGFRQHLEEEGFKEVINDKDIKDAVDGTSDETTQMRISEVEQFHPHIVAPASEQMSTTELTERSFPDGTILEPGDVFGDAGPEPISDSIPMIPRNQINAHGEVSKNGVNDLSDTNQGTEETTPGVHVATDLGLSGDNDDTRSEGMHNIEQTVDVNAVIGGISKLDDENAAKPTSGSIDVAPLDKSGEIRQLKHAFHEKIETNSSSEDTQSADLTNASVHKVEDKGDAPEVTDCAGSNESVEAFTRMDDGNAHVLSVHGDLTYVDNAETMVNGFKGEGIKFLIGVSLDPDEKSNDVQDSDPSMEDYSSGGLPARQLDEGTFITSSEVQVVGESFEVKGEIRNLVAELLPDGTEGEETHLTSSEVPVTGDDLEVEGETSKLVAKSLVDGTEGDDLASDPSGNEIQRLEELEFLADHVAVPIQSPEEQIGHHGDFILVESKEGSSTAEVSSDMDQQISSADIEVEQLKRPDGIVPGSCIVPNNEGSNVGDDSKLTLVEPCEDDNRAASVAIPVQSPEEQISHHGEFILVESKEGSSTAEVSSDMDQQISSVDIEIEPFKRPSGIVPGSCIVPNNEGYDVSDNSELTLVEPREDDNRAASEPHSIILENSRPDLLGGQLDRPDVTGTGKSDPSSVVDQNVWIKTPESDTVDQNVSIKTQETVESGTEHCRSEIGISKQGMQESQNIESHFIYGVSTSDSQEDHIDRNVESAAEISGSTDADLPQKSLQDFVAKDLLISSQDTDLKENADVLTDECTRDLVGDASHDKADHLSKEGDFPAKHGTSAADVSADSNSQTDSLEGQWGSVSEKAVLSTQSDMPVSVDAEGASGGAVKGSRKMANAPAEGEEADMFEAPSFMTLVEPRTAAGEGKGGSGGGSDIQNPQQSAAGNPAQAGWFPSITNVVNESQGRKKNEEMIAKVTNWSSGGKQQHTPLKSLLGEANREMKARSPKNVKEGEERAGGAVGTIKEEGNKEWSSPGRYQPSAEIKREKKKVKGRPYWAHLVCCASVN